MKFRLHLLLIVCILIFYKCQTKNDPFEGIIIYKLTTKSKIDSIPDKNYENLFASVDTFKTSKDGTTLNQYNSGAFEFDSYIQQENKLYYKFFNTDSVQSIDCSKSNQIILNYQHDKKVNQILGFDCDRFYVIAKNRKDTISYSVEYYYNPDLKVDWQKYEKYRHNNMSFIYKKIKSVPLKIIFHQKNFDLMIEAQKISPKKMNNLGEYIKLKFQPKSIKGFE